MFRSKADSAHSGLKGQGRDHRDKGLFISLNGKRGSRIDIVFMDISQGYGSIKQRRQYRTRYPSDLLGFRLDSIAPLGWTLPLQDHAYKLLVDMTPRVYSLDHLLAQVAALVKIHRVIQIGL